jgi:hypothetical protein
MWSAEPRLAAMTSTEPRLRDALEDEPEVPPAMVVETGGELAPLADLEERARSYARSSTAASRCGPTTPTFANRHLVRGPRSEKPLAGARARGHGAWADARFH